MADIDEIDDGIDGLGAWKVTYESADRKTIANDKFDSLRQAQHFAKWLKKIGYVEISISERR